MRIADAVDAGHTIIAATDRLARDLRVRYNADRKAAGERGWFAPPIHSFRAWTLAQWGSCWPSEQLLYSTQELSLWLYAIESSAAAESILNKTGAARAARVVSRLLSRYGVRELDLRRANPGDDEIAFIGWRDTVNRKLIERDWLTEEELPWALVDLCAGGGWTPPRSLLLVGFIERTGAQKALFDALASAGCELVEVDVLDPAEGQMTLVRPNTRRDQFRSVAARVRERLQQVRVGETVPRIGVLVPDLDEARPFIESAFREILAPHTLLAGPDSGRKPWRYGRGESMAEHPMIATVFDVLALEGGRTDLPTLSRIVLSPWLFGRARADERASFDLFLRRAGGTRFSRARVIKLARQAARGDDPNEFASAFADWLDSLENAPASALPSAWADRWSTQLELAKWGRAHESIGARQSLVDGWSEALDAYRAMDSQLREINHPRALVWLREVLHERPVQPSVDFEQPVQVFAYGDVAGMVFDYIAVCDATSTALPGPTLSTGFVSAEVLRRIGVEQASPEGMLERGRRWLGHLQRLASQIEVFAPHYDDRGAELAPTTMIPGWGDAARDETGEVLSTFDALVDQGVQAQLPSADPVGPVADAQAEGVRGGTSVLSDTAVSPLVSFLRARLGLREFPLAQDGLDARTQGVAVHRCLELAWAELHDSRGLRARSGEQLDELVAQVVHQACEEEGRISAQRFGEGLATIEQRRLRRLVRGWISYELQRAHEFVVIGHELEVQAMIAGLPLTLKIDRADRVLMEDGSERLLLIDYKTGSTRLSANAWNPDRLSEPQLPCYATHADLAPHKLGAVDGIAFAQVHEGARQFVLASNFARSLVPRKPGEDVGQGDEQWPTTLRNWREAIERLASTFMGGSTAIDRTKFERDRKAQDLAALARSARPIATNEEHAQ